MFERIRSMFVRAPKGAGEFQEGVELAGKLLPHFQFMLDGVGFNRSSFPIDRRTPMLPGYVYGFLDVCSQYMGNPSGGNTSVNAAITLLNDAFDNRGQALVGILISEEEQETPSVQYTEGVSLGCSDANKFLNREMNLGLSRLLKAKFADCCENL
jgi:hypothetical protein